MTPWIFQKEVIGPGAARLEELTGITSPVDARRFLLAVAHKESKLKERFQTPRIAGGPPGPAKSFWQGEVTGGMVTGVMGLYNPSKPPPFPRVTTAARVLCEAAAVAWTPAAVHRAIEGHDQLAYGLARLLLLTDPFKIPTDQDAAWTCYNDRLWRPGVPNRPAWPVAWRVAVDLYPF